MPDKSNPQFHVRTLDHIFKARKVAVVGASPERGTPRNSIVRVLLQTDFPGVIYLIHPRHHEVEGLKCYPDLATEWHREKNPRLQPYEFAADSPTEVWWLGSDGREWRAPIRDRVLKAAAGVAVQAAAAAS